MSKWVECPKCGKVFTLKEWEDAVDNGQLTLIVDGWTWDYEHLCDVELEEKHVGGNKTFSQMSSKELKAERDKIKELLQGPLGPSKVTSLDDYGCIIEGGALPGFYSHPKRQLRVRSRSSRYSGAAVPVSQLVKAERILNSFFDNVVGKL